METKMIQDSHISESKFEKGLRITSNIFLILGLIVFIISSIMSCFQSNFEPTDKIRVSCLNYMVLIYLLKFIMIKQKVCQVIIIIGIIVTVTIAFRLHGKRGSDIKILLKYPIFRFTSEAIITSIMVVSMCYVIYLYFIKKDQTFRDHSHWFFVVLGPIITACSIVIAITLWGSGFTDVFKGRKTKK